MDAETRVKRWRKLAIALRRERNTARFECKELRELADHYLSEGTAMRPVVEAAVRFVHERKWTRTPLDLAIAAYEAAL